MEGPDDVALLLDDAFAEVAEEELAVADADSVAVGERSAVADGALADEDRSVGGEDFEFAVFAGVVATNAQEDFAACARREEDVAFAQEVGVVGDEVFGFGGEEIELAAEFTGAAPKFAEGDLGLVAEDDFVLKGDF